MADIYLAEIEYHDPSDVSENLLYWSEDFTQDQIWRSRTPEYPVTVTANAATAPDTLVTADRLDFGAATGVVGLYQAVSVLPNTQYTFSVYVKRQDSSGETFSLFDPVNSTHIGGGPMSLAGINVNTWTRVTYTFTTSASCRLLNVYPVASTSAGGKLYVWGAMLALGDPTDYVKTSGLVTRILRAATETYTSHSPSWMPYPPRLLQPGLLKRELPLDGGAATNSYGLVEILHDGDLDGLSGCSFDGLAYVLKLVQSGASLASATTVLRASMASAEMTRTRLTIRLKDRLQTLDKPLSKHTYLGNGSTEGGPDLKDRRKPIVVCDARNISPVLVDEARLIYQVHDGALLVQSGKTSISVHDGGVPITKGADYAAMSDLLATPPASGEFRCYPPAGMFRIWGNPQGALTAYVNVALDAPFAWSTTAGALLKEMAIRAGWPAADIVDADVAALDTAPHQYQPGYYADDNISTLEVMTRIAAGLGAWFGSDALGRLRMGLLALPSGEPSASLGDAEIISLERATNPEPAPTVTVRHDKNWTVIKDPFEAAPAERRAWLAEEWRQAVEDRPERRIVHPAAKPVQIDGYGVSRDQARAIAIRLADLYSPDRDIFTARVGAGDALLSGIDLDAVVIVRTDRFGLSSGRLFRIVGIQTDCRLGRADLTLFG
jgi:hypothetical protein